MSQREVAQKMGVTDRWVRKLLKRMGKQGDAVVVHGLRGRPSNRKLPAQSSTTSGEAIEATGLARFWPNFREPTAGQTAWDQASGHTHRQFVLGIFLRRGHHESCEIRFNRHSNAVLRPPVWPAEDSDLHQPRLPRLLPRGAPVHCRSPRGRGATLSRGYYQSSVGARPARCSYARASSAPLILSFVGLR